MQRLPLSLFSNFSWTLAGNVIYAGCQWAMLVALAQLGSTEIVGQFTLGFAIAAPVMIFSNLQLRGVQATDVKGDYLFGHYFAVRVIATASAVIAIAAIGWITGYRGITLGVILVVAVAKGIESISDVFYGLLQQRHRLDHIARSMMLKGPLSLLGLAVTIYVTGNVLLAVTALAIAWAAVLCLHDWPIVSRTLNENGARNSVAPQLSRSSMQPCWEWPQLRRLAWLALPLGVTMLLGSLSSNVPLYFLERYEGSRALGIYAAASYLAGFGTHLISALGQAAIPRLATLYAGGHRTDFRRLLTKLIGFGAVVGVLGVLLASVAGTEILQILYGAEYAARADVFVWLMGAAAISYVGSMLGYSITATRTFHRFTVPYSIVAAVSIVGSAALIPLYDLRGAAWTNGLVAIAACCAGGWILIRSRAIREQTA